MKNAMRPLLLAGLILAVAYFVLQFAARWDDNRRIENWKREVEEYNRAVMRDPENRPPAPILPPLQTGGW